VQDLGGYYKGDVDLLVDAMCPSKTFNEILESI
jgi:monomeric isocitrate dehydrogenase